jgi:signal peptidase I
MDIKLKKYTKWLDPYIYLDLVIDKLFGKTNKKNKFIINILYILYSVLLAYLLYTFIGLILGTSLPLATVVSGSMEPNFYRGDIVIVANAKNIKAQIIDINENIKNKDIKDFSKMEFFPNSYGLNEIYSITIGNETINLDDTIKNNNSVVIYKSNIYGKLIIHRVVLILNANDGTYVISKGDNHKTNRIIDEDCDLSPKTLIPTKGCLNIYPINIKDLYGKKIGRIPYIGYLKLIFSKI